MILIVFIHIESNIPFLYAKECSLEEVLLYVIHQEIKKQSILTYDIEDYLANGSILEFKDFDPKEIKPFTSNDSYLGKEGGKNLFQLTSSTGQELFIKLHENISYQASIREAKWTKVMSDLKLGPKFLGLININGKKGIVIEKIKGKIIQENADLYRNKQGIRKKTFADLIKIKTTLRQNNIIPNDFQFLLTEDGSAIAIDFEMYITLNQKNHEIKQNIQFYFDELNTNPKKSISSKEDIANDQEQQYFDANIRLDYFIKTIEDML